MKLMNQNMMISSPSASPSRKSPLKSTDERVDSPYGYEVDALEVYSDIIVNRLMINLEI